MSCRLHHRTNRRTNNTITSLEKLSSNDERMAASNMSRTRHQHRQTAAAQLLVVVAVSLADDHGGRHLVLPQPDMRPKVRPDRGPLLPMGFLRVTHPVRTRILSLIAMHREANTMTVVPAPTTRMITMIAYLARADEPLGTPMWSIPPEWVCGAIIRTVTLRPTTTVRVAKSASRTCPAASSASMSTAASSEAVPCDLAAAGYAMPHGKTWKFITIPHRKLSRKASTSTERAGAAFGRTVWRAACQSLRLLAREQMSHSRGRGTLAGSSSVMSKVPTRGACSGSGSNCRLIAAPPPVPPPHQHHCNYTATAAVALQLLVCCWCWCWCWCWCAVCVAVLCCSLTAAAAATHAGTLHGRR